MAKSEDYYKVWQLFYYKVQPAFLSTKCDNLCKELRLLQSETAYLLQSASAVSLRKNDNCCQERRLLQSVTAFLLKVRQTILLQSATIFIKN